MTPEEFKKEISRLQAEFRGEYGTARLRMLWDEVQGLDVRSFRKIADDLIAESRGLPTVKEIMLRLTKMRERGRDRDKQRESTYRVEAIPKTPMPPEVKEKLERLRMRSVPKEE